MNGATEVLVSEATEGSYIRIFLDVRGFLDDYPNVPQRIRVMKHSGGAPCTQYTITLFDNDVHMQSPITHTHQMKSSRQISFTQSLDRSILLRSQGLFAKDTHFLGIKEGNIPPPHEVGRWPFFRPALYQINRKNALR